MEDDEGIENYGSEGSWFSGIVGWIIGFAVLFWIVGLFNPTKYEGQTAEEWYNEYDQCSADLENYQTAFEEANAKIEEANSNIDDTNSKIEDAKSCSYGCDFEEIQSRISDLEKAEQIEPVEEP